ncbi:MAG: glycosyltransferase family 2 protein [Lautropia sp.]
MSAAASLDGWALLGWVSAAFALLPLLMTAANLRRFDRPRGRAPAGTAVSILVPARNEAARIEPTVRAALASVDVEVEVVVLDDQSTDATAGIVRRLSAADGRVRLVRAPPLDAAWAGKQRACHLLGHAARHDVLVFIDADVRLAPRAASAAAARLLADPRVGMVSGFPRELAGSLAEKLSIPWIHLLLLGYLPFGAMRRTLDPAFGAACGQWIVARRDAWLRTGGHGASPLSRHDGLSLPRTFRSAGWATDLFDGHELASCRMYQDLRGVCTGFAKSVGEGLATPVALPVWTVLLALGHVLPWALLPAAAWHPALLAPAIAGVAANLALRALLCVRFGQSPLGAVLHPLGALLMLGINWVALTRYLAGRPSEWAGRMYPRTPARGTVDRRSA